MTRLMRLWLHFLLACAPVFAAHAAPLLFKERCLADLVAQVPAILASQNPANGRFGTGLWIVNDQNVLLPLAIAWSQRSEQNPFYRRADVLKAIVAGGEALIADQDANGQWVFRKKDGSTWGNIYMPWTYSRWIRAYQIVREALPADIRERWDRALQLGFQGIAREVAASKTTANIPTHHAMALLFASQVFQRDDWAAVSRQFMARVLKAQHRDGYWTENSGPVINYGFVYVEALGIYAQAARDESLREPLRRAAVFHAHFTYPDGTDVETVDERNPYEHHVQRGNVGFTLTPEGRAYLARQMRLAHGQIPADAAATMLTSGEEGEIDSGNDTSRDFTFRLGDGDALVRRQGPWFIVVSAFNAPISERRWIQDRQNFVSIYHEHAGLILGGGNTKLQPRWSSFTSGAIDSFHHRAGDENPKFTPPAGIVHVPAQSRLLEGGDPGVRLNYAGKTAEIRLRIRDDRTLEYIVSGDPALTAHITLLPHLASPLRSEKQSAALTQASLTWDAAATGNWIEHRKARVFPPAGGSVRWPVLPHNPYRKDGAATPAEGRIVISAPLKETAQTFRIEILP